MSDSDVSQMDEIMSQPLPEPTDCDRCSNNFLSHKIYFCPDCDQSYCSTCWDTEHHCYDEDDLEEETR